MKKFRVIIIIIVSLIIFGLVNESDLYDKCKLAILAKSLGATNISIDNESVNYELDNMLITVYDADYEIEKLSGK